MNHNGIDLPDYKKTDVSWAIRHYDKFYQEIKSGYDDCERAYNRKFNNGLDSEIKEKLRSLRSELENSRIPKTENYCRRNGLALLIEMVGAGFEEEVNALQNSNQAIKNLEGRTIIAPAPICK